MTVHRDQSRRRQDLPDVSSVADGVILALWREKYDTVEIARLTHLTEAQVFNRLLHVREAGR